MGLTVDEEGEVGRLEGYVEAARPVVDEVSMWALRRPGAGLDKAAHVGLALLREAVVLLRAIERAVRVR